MDPLLEQTARVIKDLHAEIVKQIQGLPDAALDWKPGPDTSSIHILVTHILGLERTGLYIAAGDIAARDRDAEFRVVGATADGLIRLLNDANAGVEVMLSRIDTSMLGETVDVRGTPIIRAYGLQHAVEHVGIHTGQIQLTRQLWEQSRD